MEVSDLSSKLMLQSIHIGCFRCSVMKYVSYINIEKAKVTLHSVSHARVTSASHVHFFQHFMLSCIVFTIGWTWFSLVPSTMLKQLAMKTKVLFMDL